MWTLLHRRDDGSFVIRLANGWPFHVEASDPLFPAVLAAAEGVELPDELHPEPLILPPALPSPREFMDRLTAPRQAEITLAAMQSAPLLLWLLRLSGAREIDPAHAETIAGVHALRTAGVITEAEQEALLA